MKGEGMACRCKELRKAEASGLPASDTIAHDMVMAEIDGLIAEDIEYHDLERG